MDNPNKEVRVSTDLKADDGEKVTIYGYAAVFDQTTQIDWFDERIEAGAFTESLRASDIHALYNHSYDSLPLGRLSAGTLRAEEDERGLKVEIDLPDTQFARDLRASMDRGDVDQMSFAFSMAGGVDEWDDTGDRPVRTIKRVGELYDVTVCPRGAYPQTECALRSFEKWKSKRNFDNARTRIHVKKNYLRSLGEKGAAG